MKYIISKEKFPTPHNEAHVIHCSRHADNICSDTSLMNTHQPSFRLGTLKAQVGSDRKTDTNAWGK